MPRPLHPWTQAVLAHLADGEGHHRDDAVVTGIRYVPPGRALPHQLRGKDSTVLDELRLVVLRAQGQRSIVMAAVRQRVRSGELEASEHHGHPQVRLAP